MNESVRSVLVLQTFQRGTGGSGKGEGTEGVGILRDLGVTSSRAPVWVGGEGWGSVRFKIDEKISKKVLKQVVIGHTWSTT